MLLDQVNVNEQMGKAHDLKYRHTVQIEEGFPAYTPLAETALRDLVSCNRDMERSLAIRFPVERVVPNEHELLNFSMATEKLLVKAAFAC